ncbi:hypothetical protein NHX12_019637 [Muraenolepis orangiensis]|uniref:G-protein coupled receptors family 1 profile domain-containing protein n=1 Tax=Muraenolepis orangiensis TaxID=630683 RepID=A0A9Q0EVS0_9TELE|nr:hypothetical protein NHX12_019637 [Muraenolepis orangiensis]
MEADRWSNASLVDFVGGVQLLEGEGTRTALPVLLVGVCVSGAVGNLLVLLALHGDFRAARGSEVKALLAAVASADLAVLLLCAPVRALAYYRRTWTLGGFLCRTSDWFQHACVVAKTLTLAATSLAEHNAAPEAAVPCGGGGGGGGGAAPRLTPTWIHGALALIWTVSALFPIPQFLFASLRPRGDATFVCVWEAPSCAADFLSVFYKVYPALGFALPIAFTLTHHTRALHAALNHAPTSAGARRRQSKVTLVLLCVSGANALLLLPEWCAVTWTRLGYDAPPAGLAVFAQVLLYAGSCALPAILMTTYDDVRRGVARLWFACTCRGGGAAAAKRHAAAVNSRAKSGAEVGARDDAQRGAEEEEEEEVTSRELDKTFPDVEHFWTGRRNTHVEDDQDPVPWESGDKML